MQACIRIAKEKKKKALLKKNLTFSRILFH